MIVTVKLYPPYCSVAQREQTLSFHNTTSVTVEVLIQRLAMENPKLKAMDGFREGDKGPSFVVVDGVAAKHCEKLTSGQHVLIFSAISGG